MSERLVPGTTRERARGCRLVTEHRRRKSQRIRTYDGYEFASTADMIRWAAANRRYGYNADLIPLSVWWFPTWDQAVAWLNADERAREAYRSRSQVDGL